MGTALLSFYLLPASGSGARVSACAGLINQLQRCRFDSRIACLENIDAAIVGDRATGVGGHHALNAKKSHLGYLISIQLPTGFREFHFIYLRTA